MLIPFGETALPHPDPIVDLFLRTDPEPESLVRGLRALGRPIPAKVEAIQVLLEATLGLRPKEHLKQIDWAYREPANVDLHMLFLITWFRALFFVEPDWSRMHMLRDRIMALLSPDTPAEIVGWARLTDGLTRFYDGDTLGYISALEKVTEGIARTSPHYLRLALIRVITLMMQGMGAVAELPQAPPGIGEIFQLRLRNLRVANAGLTGDLDAVCSADIEPDSGPPNARSVLWPTEYEVACHTLRLMAEASPKAAAHRPLAAKIGQCFGDEVPAWVKSARCLLEGRPGQALQWARAHVNEPPSSRRTVVGFDEYALIRAELAAGHADAAKRLLLARHARRSWHYVDDLFFARAELLAGSADLAAEHFARLLQAAETYRASGRIDFELRLACELTVTALVELTRAAERARDTRVAAEPLTGTAKGSLQRLRGIDRIVHVSDSLSTIRDHLLSFAASDLPVLITGDTGTGKELVALALHEAGPHKDAPFTAINCAALSDTLVESELFGHERGAFTGAQTAHAGLFRDAGEGTVFLDEIGDISPRLQAVLLRVLETREVRPVGGTRSYRFSCRVVAATNADLERKVELGLFRRDLLFRLLRLRIHMPSLAERPEDVKVLASHFLNLGRAAGELASMSPALEACLRAQPWAGNVRELRNVVERLRVLNSDKLAYDIGDLDGALFGTPFVSLATADEGNPEGETATGTGRREFPPAGDPLGPSATSPTRAASLSPISGKEDPALEVITASRSPLRRLDRLRQLFERFEKLQASEVGRILEVSRHTAARDLRRLCQEGMVEKVAPTASPRTHYYVLRRDRRVDSG